MTKLMDPDLTGVCDHIVAAAGLTAADAAIQAKAPQQEVRP